MKNIFKKENNNARQNTYFDGYAKTESLQGSNLGTETIFEKPMVNYDTVPPTRGVAGGNLVDLDTTDGGVQPVTGDFGHTISGAMIRSKTGTAVNPVVGWIVCVKGANIGKAYELHSGYNYIGRGAKDIIIEGDEEISGEHMCIAYDPVGRSYTLSKEKARNMIYLNGKAVNQVEEIYDYDTIRTGSSEFVFIGFCGERFNWRTKNDD